jgi:hypothetical protein
MPVIFDFALKSRFQEGLKAPYRSLASTRVSGLRKCPRLYFNGLFSAPRYFPPPQGMLSTHLAAQDHKKTVHVGLAQVKHMDSSRRDGVTGLEYCESDG